MREEVNAREQLYKFLYDAQIALNRYDDVRCVLNRLKKRLDTKFVDCMYRKVYWNDAEYFESRREKIVDEDKEPEILMFGVRDSDEVR